MRYVIEVPLPTKKCSSNFRGHTRTKGKAIRDYRRLCAAYYVAAKVPTLRTKADSPTAKPIILHLEFFYAKTIINGKAVPDIYQRCQDETNARESFKAGQDALKDAGIVPDDTARYVTIGRTILHTTKASHKGLQKVVVTLETQD